MDILLLIEVLGLHCGSILSFVHSMDFDQYIKHLSIITFTIQNSFTALQLSHIPPIILPALQIPPMPSPLPFPPLSPWEPLIFLLLAQVILFQNTILLKSHTLKSFQICFFHLAIGI